jgi:hypothetical protein
MQAILQGNGHPRLRIILTTGVNDGDAGHAACDTAHDIGPNPAVKMHDMRATEADDLVKPWDQSDVEIALHANGMDLGQGSCRLRQITTDPAGHNVFDPTGLEPFHEEKNLMRAAVKITTALNVEDPHGRGIRTRGLLDQSQQHTGCDC